MGKKSRSNFGIKSPLCVGLGAVIAIGISAIAMALISAGVSNGVIGFDTSVWFLLFGQIISVFLGVFVCQKLGKKHCVFDTVIVVCTYLCLLTLIAIMVFDGISGATLFAMVTSLVGGIAGDLVCRIEFGNRINKRRRKLVR